MMKIAHRTLNIFTILFISTFLSSCLSMSSMQTARVTEKGDVAFGVGGGYVKSEIALGTLDTISLGAPYMELSARYGITERLDVGAKLGIIGTAGVDAKYQFLGNNESMFATSAGLGVYYVSIESGDSKSNIVDLHIPIYLSLHPADNFSLYAAPKFVLRSNSYSIAGESSGSSSSNWLGVTTGIRLGRKTALFAEYSYFGSSDHDLPLGQFMLGIGIGIR